MSNHKTIEMPDPIETVKACLADPDNSEFLVLKPGLEYISACLANREREETIKERGLLGPDLELDKMEPKRLRALSGEGTVKIPRLRGESRPRAAVGAVIDAIERRFRKAVALLYVSGASDRDISRDLAELGITLSRSGVSDVYRACERERRGEFMNRRFSGKTYIDLQVDSMFVKARVPTAPGVEEFRELALARTIGLNAENGCFEPVSLMVLPGESSVGYGILFDRLTNQGLRNAYLVGTDFNTAFPSAAGAGFGHSQWQGCVFRHEMNAAKRAGEFFDDVVEIYREVHGGRLRPAGAERLMIQKAGEMETANPEISKALVRRLRATLPHLEYPARLAGEISNTNRDERSNEEGRRREAAIHAFPGVEAAIRLFWTVFDEQARRWILCPDPAITKGGVLPEAVQTHERMAAAAYLEVREQARSHPQCFDSPLTDVKAVAVWANVVTVPVSFGAAAMAVPFLRARAVDRGMNVKLIALAPIQDLSPDGLKMAVAERLTERGVDTERVELIIVNRPFFDFEEVLLKAFPKARLFSDPHTFIESVEYLALSPEWPVRRLLRWVFQANSFNEASARMRAFGEETAINRLEMAEWHCGWYGGDRVVNIYRLLDAGLWGGATPWDFRPHSNCVRLVKNLCGNPRDAKKTMGLLVASFKRKRHTYKEPTA